MLSFSKNKDRKERRLHPISSRCTQFVLVSFVVHFVVVERSARLLIYAGLLYNAVCLERRQAIHARYTLSKTAGQQQRGAPTPALPFGIEQLFLACER